MPGTALAGVDPDSFGSAAAGSNGVGSAAPALGGKLPATTRDAIEPATITVEAVATLKVAPLLPKLRQSPVSAASMAPDPPAHTPYAGFRLMFAWSYKPRKPELGLSPDRKSVV